MDLTKALDKRKRRLATAIAVLVGFFVICLVIDPQRYIASVYNGIVLFATSVAPALFPFFFFTRILTSVGTAQILGDALKKPIAKLYNCPSVGGYVFFMSAISGYPVGSRLLSDLYSAGIIDRRQAKAISAFTSTSGPLFVVGTVGTVMFGSASFGYLLLAIHFASAVINGFIYRIKKDDVKEYAELLRTPPDFDDLLGKSMTSALMSLFVVGGYAVGAHPADDGLLGPVEELEGKEVLAIVNGVGVQFRRGQALDDLPIARPVHFQEFLTKGEWLACHIKNADFVRLKIPKGSRLPTSGIS